MILGELNESVISSWCCCRWAESPVLFWELGNKHDIAAQKYPATNPEKVMLCCNPVGCGEDQRRGRAMQIPLPGGFLTIHLSLG